MPQPQQLVALVTGASRGVGRGVSTALAAAGARVFATGRSIQQADLPPIVTALVCDHTDDAAVEAVFAGSTTKPAGSTCWSTRPGAATSGWWRTGASPGRRRSGSNRPGDGSRC